MKYSFYYSFKGIIYWSSIYKLLEFSFRQSFVPGNSKNNSSWSQEKDEKKKIDINYYKVFFNLQKYVIYTYKFIVKNV